jgi:4,5-DOPA dioxygenase extradiol
MKEIDMALNVAPVLFVAHGSPMMALRPGAAGAALTQMGKQLQAPRAIVVISPHWATPEVSVGVASHLETIHDSMVFRPPFMTFSIPQQGVLKRPKRLFKL